MYQNSSDKTYQSVEKLKLETKKLNFIINSFKSRYDLYEKSGITIKEEKEICDNAEKAAKLLGELWFDLWS